MMKKVSMLLVVIGVYLMLMLTAGSLLATSTSTSTISSSNRSYYDDGDGDEQVGERSRSNESLLTSLLLRSSPDQVKQKRQAGGTI